MKNLVKGYEYLPIVLISLILYKLVNNFEIVKKAYGLTLAILNPFLWGFTFAYLINPMMVQLEQRLRINRWLSVIISYALVGTILTIASRYIFPEIAASITEIIRNIPTYFSNIEAWVYELSSRYPEFYIRPEMLTPILENYQEYARYGTTMLSTLILGALGLANQLFKLVIGVIISIYFLLDKEKFITGSKKLVIGTLAHTQAQRLLRFAADVNTMFSKFIIGKTLDSIIIGVLCYGGMVFIKAPYPILFALIIGITNMIPFFGPFFGAIPVIIITVFVSPVTGVWVGLFILLLQQFDGYILGPKILGDSVGLSPFWIILSIVIGGSLLGVLGMIIAVPATAVIRNRVIAFLDQRIAEKDNPISF